MDGRWGSFQYSTHLPMYSMLRLKCFISSYVSWLLDPVDQSAMDAIVSRLQTMTEERLRDSMLAAGLKCGPVTSSTRGTYEKTLARALMRRERVAFDGSERGNGLDEEERSTGLSEEARDPRLNLSQSGEETEGGESTAAMCTDGERPRESTSVFYGVCPQRQEEDTSAEEEKAHVFEDQKTALKVMAAMKGARLKAFPTCQEAEVFSKGTNRPAAPEPGTLWHASVEKANEFPSPRTQDLTGKLRRAVEQGDQEGFMKLVWENPRYLIGSGDNPTAVHLGCHYNVLHVAAKGDRPGIVRALLDTLNKPQFMGRMYPGDRESVLRRRIRYVVDLYLNTPDATNNDTPLHLACKFGCPEVVDLLCSHPATHTQPRNKYGQRPRDVICERRNHTPETREQIREYLEDRCYLHLLRASDNTGRPVIMLTRSPGSQLKQDFLSLDFGREGRPLDPSLALRAYVGPLSPSKAEEFYRLWTNPPRNQAGKPKAKDFRAVLKTDPDRGMESVGREMAREMGHRWAEHWHFLDCFIDLSTEEGLDRLEGYLEERDKSEVRQNTVNVALIPASTSRKGHLSSSTTNCSVPPLCDLLQLFENLSISPDNQEKADGLASIEREAVLSSTTDGSVPPLCDLLQQLGNLLVSPDSQEKANGTKDNLATSGREREVGLDLEDHCRPSKSRPSPLAQEGIDLASGLRAARGMRSSEEQQKQTEDEDDDDVSSTSSEEYLTADEDYHCSEQEREDREGSSEITPLVPEARVLFLGGGDSPSRLDRQVLSALENVQVDAERYPLITKWRNLVQAYPST